jgi:uncharacterized damage-inducible protein DinB
MSAALQRVLELSPEYRSPAVARYLWQLDDQTRRLIEATRDATPEALAWQPAPGANTMGMLLAHVAVAETHIASVLIEGRPDSDVHQVLGIGPDDDGLPLPAGARPPEILAGKDVAFFHELLRRAREHTRRCAIVLTEADLDRRIVRQPADGTTRHYNVDWGFYHLLEHLAGHHAQILLIRHLHAARA